MPSKPQSALGFFSITLLDINDSLQETLRSPLVALDSDIEISKLVQRGEKNLFEKSLLMKGKTTPVFSRYTFQIMNQLPV